MPPRRSTRRYQGGAAAPITEEDKKFQVALNGEKDAKKKAAMINARFQLKINSESDPVKKKALIDQKEQIMTMMSRFNGLLGSVSTAVKANNTSKAAAPVPVPGPVSGKKSGLFGLGFFGLGGKSKSKRKTKRNNY